METGGVKDADTVRGGGWDITSSTNDTGCSDPAAWGGEEGGGWTAFWSFFEERELERDRDGVGVWTPA
jgi:hypothetical protein